MKMSAPQAFHDGRVMLHGGDCLAVLKTLPDCSVDSVVTDPPYHLASIVKRFGPRADGGANAPCKTYEREGATGSYARASKGFMGKAWDGGDIAFRPDVWRECLRVLKPGGHLAAFAAAKNYHHMAVAIEAAGFEARNCLFNVKNPAPDFLAFLDSLSDEQAGAFARLLDGSDNLAAWVYGSGFPKSLDVAKALQKAAVSPSEAARAAHAAQSATRAAMVEFHGWGTDLKPAFEPIFLARKPLSETSVARNVVAHGTGAINVDACRVNAQHWRDSARAIAEQSPEAPGRRGEASADRRYDESGATNFAALPGVRGGDPRGRWPANILHDGSDCAVAGFPQSAGQQRYTGPEYGAKASVNVYGDFREVKAAYPRGDSGSAARYFYSAKADADDRLGSKHPTVKPLDLMRWLVRLVTPPGGTVLDPFAGTGTTGHAALLEGFCAILVEREAEYRADIARRMAHVFSGADERRIVRAKTRGAGDDAGPLFAAPAVAGEGAARASRRGAGASSMTLSPATSRSAAE